MAPIFLSGDGTTGREMTHAAIDDEPRPCISLHGIRSVARLLRMHFRFCLVGSPLELRPEPLKPEGQEPYRMELLAIKGRLAFHQQPLECV